MQIIEIIDFAVSAALAQVLLDLKRVVARWMDSVAPLDFPEVSVADFGLAAAPAVVDYSVLDVVFAADNCFVLAAVPVDMAADLLVLPPRTIPQRLAPRHYLSLMVNSPL